ncbi:MAG: Hsp20/alpha crystallin family protein [Thermoproteota archaeon]|nr:Hsp20/alpha crystallin family protein [Thermoproteota archaeon]
MSIRDIDNYDLFKRFFGRSGGNTGRGFFDMDPFSAFEEMKEEMGRMFGQFQDIQTNAPKELVREYQTPDGGKVREVGPIVYGYSMTIGPDGKPKVREFGNVKSPGQMGLTTSTSAGRGAKPSQQITAEREPLVDVNTNDKEVKLVLELPGVKKEDIKISAYGEAVEVTANNTQRKYHKTIELPKEANTDTAKSTYHNGILEITFSKRENAKPKGREIKIE